MTLANVGLQICEDNIHLFRERNTKGHFYLNREDNMKLQNPAEDQDEKSDSSFLSNK